MNADALIDRIENQLLSAKVWRFLRYLHALDSVGRIADDISSVVVCGAGGGMSEVALALRYPHIHFTLTDIIDREHGYPSYPPAMDFCWRHGIDNVSFSVWNVLQPTKRRFDLVMSTEMLEHIPDDRTAALNMRAAAERYIYCLVPFADPAANQNPRIIARAKEKAEHERPGYDAETLIQLFGQPSEIAGCYWKDAGFAFRAKLTDMSGKDILDQAKQLKMEAKQDLKGEVPQLYPEALGIKIMSAI